jgi:hypothetical protein
LSEHPINYKQTKNISILTEGVTIDLTDGSWFFRKKMKKKKMPVGARFLPRILNFARLPIIFILRK